MQIQHFPVLEKANYSVADAAEFLTVTKSYVHQLCRSGELESFTVGSRRVIPANALMELITRGYQSQIPGSHGCDSELPSGEPCAKRPIAGTDLCWAHTKRD